MATRKAVPKKHAPKRKPVVKDTPIIIEESSEPKLKDQPRPFRADPILDIPVSAPKRSLWQRFLDTF